MSYSHNHHRCIYSYCAYIQASKGRARARKTPNNGDDDELQLRLLVCIHIRRTPRRVRVSTSIMIERSLCPPRVGVYVRLCVCVKGHTYIFIYVCVCKGLAPFIIRMRKPKHKYVTDTNSLHHNDPSMHNATRLISKRWVVWGVSANCE